MNGFPSTALKLSKFMNIVAGIALVIMMLFTVSDVILRIVWRPIVGTYELVALIGAMVIGFAIPKSSSDDAHVYVDMLTGGLSVTAKKVFQVITKFLGLIVFVLLGWNIFLKGNELYHSKEVTLTVHAPLYPVAYLLGLCCLVESLVLLSQAVMTIRSGDKHE
jgi:TRAP-type C4-dicarboxylate transport system permease small subunit